LDARSSISDKSRYALEEAVPGPTDVSPLNPGISKETFTALQRSSRASDNPPMHIRMDGPGYDTMDVPFNTHEPKLQFTMFVPTADFFATLRINQASLDLVTKYNVSANNNGLERFLTTTRRQNFLVPPRAHRVFPLAEL
jgi:hypothetical protein